MEIEQFNKMFKIGDTLDRENFSMSFCIEIKHMGENEVSFFGKDKDGFYSEWPKELNWKLCPPTKPEWDWDADFMWGQSCSSCLVKLLEISEFFYQVIDEEGNLCDLISAKEIEKQFKPCLPPSNASDYDISPRGGVMPEITYSYTYKDIRDLLIKTHGQYSDVDFTKFKPDDYAFCTVSNKIRISKYDSTHKRKDRLDKILVRMNLNTDDQILDFIREDGWRIRLLSFKSCGRTSYLTFLKRFEHLIKKVEIVD